MMATIRRWLFGPDGLTEDPDGLAEGNDAEGSDVEEAEPAAPFRPSVIDVLVVRAMLAKRLQFPPELVDIIVEAAEYWACFSTERHGDSLRVHGNTNSADGFLIRSRPLGFPKCPVADVGEYSAAPAPPAELQRAFEAEDLQRRLGMPTAPLKSPCRKIVFTIQSRDQGWGGNPADHGTHRHSWTWFSAGLERLDAEATGQDGTPFTSSNMRPLWPPIEPDVNAEPPKMKYTYPLLPDEGRKIQNNIVASREPSTYTIVWSHTDNIDPESEEAAALDKEGRGKGTGNGEFVRNLMLGDAVTIWAHARFPMWVNRVYRAGIEIYWAV